MPVELAICCTVSPIQPIFNYSMENRGYTRSFDRVWAQNSILTLVNLEFCAHTRSFFWIKLGHKIPDSLMVGWNFVPIHDLLDLFIRS